MRPFFGHYGSKWHGAKHYGPPRRDRVVEAFAGSACYSVWWEPRIVHLYDKSERTCQGWDWLINCSADDVRRLPDTFQSTEECLALPDGPRQIVWWNINYGEGGKRPRKTLRKWYLECVATGDRSKYSNRFFWGPRVKARLIDQKPLIAKWTVEQMCYSKIPDMDAHWHIDPPYSGPAGGEYEHSEIDYKHLAQWCRERTGAVDVCENEGADWLPFTPLYSLKSMHSAHQSREVVWRNDAVLLTDLM